MTKTPRVSEAPTPCTRLSAPFPGADLPGRREIARDGLGHGAGGRAGAAGAAAPAAPAHPPPVWMLTTAGIVRRLFMTRPKSSRLSSSTVKDPCRLS